jgi:class 3 adenylate cyclase
MLGLKYHHHVMNAWANKLSLVMFPAASYFPLMVVSVLWSKYKEQADATVSYVVYSGMFGVYAFFVCAAMLFFHFPSMCCGQKKEVPIFRYAGLVSLLGLVVMCYALMCFYHAMQSCDAAISTTPIPAMALIHLRILLPGTRLGVLIIIMSIVLFACIPLMNPTCYFSTYDWIKTFVPEFLWFMLCTAICFMDNLAFRDEDRAAFDALGRAQTKYRAAKGESLLCARLIENIIPPEYKNVIISECGDRIANSDGNTVTPMFVRHLEFMTCMAIDGVHFTQFCAGKPVGDIVRIMGNVFEIIDGMIQHSHYARKIKQVGDASHLYFTQIPVVVAVAASLSRDELCHETVDFGMRVMCKIARTVTDLSFRCGIACGSGSLILIGEQRISFDCVGESKSLAEQMESTGVENLIQCCPLTAKAVQGHFALRLIGERHIIVPMVPKLLPVAGESVLTHSKSLASIQVSVPGKMSKLKKVLRVFGINANIKPLEMLLGVDLSGGIPKIIKRAEELYQKKRMVHGIMFAVVIVATFAIVGCLILSDYPRSAASHTSNTAILIAVCVLGAVQALLGVAFIAVSRVFVLSYAICNFSNVVFLASIAVAFFFDATTATRFSSAFVFTLDAAIACHGIYLFPAEILLMIMTYNGLLITLALTAIPIVFGTSILETLAANWMFYMSAPIACVFFALGEYFTRYTSISKHRDEARALSYDRHLRKKLQLSQNLLKSFLPDNVIAHYATNTLQECNVTYKNAIVLIGVIQDFVLRYHTNRAWAIDSLHQIFTAFDNLQALARISGGGSHVILEKVKSSGEQYIAFAHSDGDDGANAIQCAVTVCHTAKTMIGVARATSSRMRIGIAMGEVCACVVGTKKYQYDIYSSAVNMAARLSTASAVNAEILCQGEVAKMVASKNGGLSFQAVGVRSLKGIGDVEVCQLLA